MVLLENTLVPSQQSLAFFSAGEPASVFTGTAGVVAGTGSLIMRRWNGRGGGGRRGGPGIAGSQSSPGAFSLEQVSAPVLLGETDSCGVVSESSIQAGFENSLEDADFAVAGAENDFNDAQVVVPGSSGAGAGSSCSLQDDFAVVKVEDSWYFWWPWRGEPQRCAVAAWCWVAGNRHLPLRPQARSAGGCRIGNDETFFFISGQQCCWSAMQRVEYEVLAVLPPAAGGICTVSQCNR